MGTPLRVADDVSFERLRCAPFHASLAVDPAGTAGSYDVFLCVEVPLPWQRDVSLHEPFRSMMPAPGASVVGADGRRFRPQGLVSRPGAEGWTRVLLFERPRDSEPAAGPYRRREWWLQPAEVEVLCRALLDADDDGVAAFDERRVEVPARVVDLLVCTHGKRDVCCGTYGVAVHEALTGGIGPEGRADGVRLWRTSHTGGHRFAPTALTFPDGYAWAHLDTATALGVADRTLAPEAARRLCRGASSVEGGPAQVADAAALAEVGWEWASAERTVTVTAFDRRTLATDLLVEGRVGAGEDGRDVRLAVRVELDRHVPQVTCGAIDGPEYTVEPAWRVTSVDPA